MIARVGIVCLLALGAGGCATKGPASVAGGECRIFERPQYAVRGKRSYDQDWIDSQVEGGVGGCGWKRPAARPAALDAVPTKRPVTSPGKAEVKKRNVIQRIKDRISGPPASAPVPYVAAPIMPAVAAPTPAPVPRDPVDELLQPSESPRRVY
jgi:hypothetical protein